jgi:hypothetical protein
VCHELDFYSNNQKRWSESGDICELVTTLLSFNGKTKLFHLVRAVFILPLNLGGPYLG